MSKLSLPIRVARVLICTLLLAAALSGCFYLHHTALPFLRANLSELKIKPAAWIVKQLSFSLPFILICLFLSVAYRGTDRHDGSVSREKQWIVILLSIFAYAVLLPYVRNLSGDMYAASVAAGADIPLTDAGEPWTLMLKSVEWFVRLAIPLILLIIFYGVRATREKVSPDSQANPSDAPIESSEKEMTYEA